MYKFVQIKPIIIITYSTHALEMIVKLGKPDFVHEKRHMDVEGEGGGGCSLTFLCKTSWNNSIVFSKALIFRNHLCRI
jgi:hypothetical protein